MKKENKAESVVGPDPERSVSQAPGLAFNTRNNGIGLGTQLQ